MAEALRVMHARLASDLDFKAFFCKGENGKEGVIQNVEKIAKGKWSLLLHCAEMKEQGRRRAGLPSL